MLEETDEKIEAEDIQTKIYDIGMSLEFEKLKGGFKVFIKLS